VNKRQERKGHPPTTHPSPMIMMMARIRCNAMSMPVDDDASCSSSGGAAAGVMGSSHPHMQMVHCNTEEGGLLKVLVTRSDPTMVGTTVMTEEQAIPRAPLTGTAAERHYMEHKWCEKLWQAMQRVQRSKNRHTTREVEPLERAAKRQCKKDECQTKALLATARDWRAHVYDPLSAEAVTRQATLVKECLKEERALAKRKGETLPWLECLPSGIRESKLLEPLVERCQWAQHAARKAAGEYMVEREDENDISTDEEDAA
jgi:hypothetical protein